MALALEIRPQPEVMASTTTGTVEHDGRWRCEVQQASFTDTVMGFIYRNSGAFWPNFMTFFLGSRLSQKPEADFVFIANPTITTEQVRSSLLAAN